MSEDNQPPTEAGKRRSLPRTPPEEAREKQRQREMEHSSSKAKTPASNPSPSKNISVSPKPPGSSSSSPSKGLLKSFRQSLSDATSTNQVILDPDHQDWTPGLMNPDFKFEIVNQTSEPVHVSFGEIPDSIFLFDETDKKIGIPNSFFVVSRNCEYSIRVQQKCLIHGTADLLIPMDVSDGKVDGRKESEKVKNRSDASKQTIIFPIKIGF